MKWPISCRRISRTSPTANVQPQISAYAATAMKILANLTRTNENFASASAAPMIGAKSFFSRARQSVPFGWIGS